MNLEGEPPVSRIMAWSSLLWVLSMAVAVEDIHVVRWAIPWEYSRRPHLTQPIGVVSFRLRTLTGADLRYLFTRAPAEVYEDPDDTSGIDAAHPWLEPAAPPESLPPEWRSLFRR